MLIRLVVYTLALLAVFFLVWNVSSSEQNIVLTAVVMALLLAVINAFIRPIVLLLTLPLSVITLGLFALVINALLFWIAALVVHIHVDFWRAALGYVVFVLITAAQNQLGMTDTA